jgi:hypothetical protein
VESPDDSLGVIEIPSKRLGPPRPGCSPQHCIEDANLDNCSGLYKKRERTTDLLVVDEDSRNGRKRWCRR